MSNNFQRVFFTPFAFLYSFVNWFEPWVAVGITQYRPAILSLHLCNHPVILLVSCQLYIVVIIICFERYIVSLMRRYSVTLTHEERDILLSIISKGKHSSQKVLNALILLGCDEGEFQTTRSTNEELTRVLPISMRKIDRVKKRFVLESFDEALTGKKPDRTYIKKTDGDFEARLIALSCSDPPDGFSRWSLRLLADKVVELQYIDAISHEGIRQIFKKRTQTMENTVLGNTSGAKL